ncbi:endonuclease/exonuclease/phosphatase family protein [Ichthyenterobacterium magnum]|uniref:Endonuclease/exonuclease/phosphatase domain-containing protein n=1 Tax=Ichthyenterobacterium magnum TaxID=1230530 RepID=A0A420DWR8_9FLAO|nr:endonuclease/exonuclease/phosphatase family protein [Ichthyenterobacterium magnum]RKE98678.1 hypothetical protein BXY80_0771 [Ichthyenterobacterium magnum]
MENLETINNIHTVAFYNVENLFNIVDDASTHDNDFLPSSEKRWTKKRYERKVYKLGSVISKIGFEDSNKAPTIVGLAEVEGKDVIEDLIKSKDLEPYNYGFVHYDSKDERGIDVALLYNKDNFVVESSKIFSVYLEDEKGEQDFTRDILLVSGMLEDEKTHLLVNHWSSRRDGEKETAYKRIAASNKLLEIIENLKQNEVNPKIIVMGDFNDNPNNTSVKQLVKIGNLFNPMETLWSYEKGSQSHNFRWNLFDQILFSVNFFETKKGRFKFDEANIFNEKFLTQHEGKYKGQPYRTYVGKKYKGGYSDHFPVFIKIRK